MSPLRARRIIYRVARARGLEREVARHVVRCLHADRLADQTSAEVEHDAWNAATWVLGGGVIREQRVAR